MDDSRPIKVLLAKLGLDGHDRGVKVVARALQDAGMEVVYMGMRVTADNVADRAQEESADVIGISLLSGAHKKLMQAMVTAIEKREIRHETLLLVGGTIPESEEEELAAIGVDGVFPVGSSLADIENFIREHLKPRT